MFYLYFFLHWFAKKKIEINLKKKKKNRKTIKIFDENE